MRKWSGIESHAEAQCSQMNGVGKLFSSVNYWLCERLKGSARLAWRAIPAMRNEV